MVFGVTGSGRVIVGILEALARRARPDTAWGSDGKAPAAAARRGRTRKSQVAGRRKPSSHDMHASGTNGGRDRGAGHGAVRIGDA